MKKMSIPIYLIRMGKDLEVTHQMAHYEADENEAGGGHEEFPANR